jgi:hypothetical protein
VDVAVARLLDAEQPQDQVAAAVQDADERAVQRQ